MTISQLVTEETLKSLRCFTCPSLILFGEEGSLWTDFRKPNSATNWISIFSCFLLNPCWRVFYWAPPGWSSSDRICIHLSSIYFAFNSDLPTLFMFIYASHIYTFTWVHQQLFETCPQLLSAEASGWLTASVIAALIADSKDRSQ